MPADTDSKRQLESLLGTFASLPLKEAATAFWQALGYRSERTLAVSDKFDFRQQFDREANLDEAAAHWADWQEVAFLFQVTDEEIRASSTVRGSLFESSGSLDNQEIHSYVFFAVRLSGERYTRTQLAGIKLSANPARSRCFKKRASSRA